jgi:hypothetical protein
MKIQIGFLNNLRTRQRPEQASSGRPLAFSMLFVEFRS